MTAKNNKKALGGLISEASLELHSAASLDVWNGSHRNGRRIASMPEFFHKMSVLEVAAVENDPYADYALINIENALNDAFVAIEMLEGGLPIQQGHRRLNTQVCRSRQPVVKPLYIKSRFGWRFIALFELFDVFMVDLMDAQFKARVTRQQFEASKKTAFTVVRKVLEIGMSSVHSGISRNDVSANNAKATQAIEKFGLIPLEVMEGIVRAEYAPQIKQRA
ncbi:TIGR03761 family integrating conjugative element protein [Photobacterium frigidiphilum]|uniref:TIGR03761 family integrating conjugative element protein n=1 Tax=Photobacterium frigidiphilum TaxID=264736 RepID=A0A2T3J6V0_9GAMM|nr:TIGR03761 family integrating conjugative element protein [Photobacterium frigidiphilum]PSU44267.1 TIGR03761 family integrating conjugative element protein [Photobacterium frigidiphilum]